MMLSLPALLFDDSIIFRLIQGMQREISKMKLYFKNADINKISIRIISEYIDGHRSTKKNLIQKWSKFHWTDKLQ